MWEEDGCVQELGLLEGKVTFVVGDSDCLGGSGSSIALTMFE